MFQNWGMENKMKKFWITAGTIFVFSYLFNFIWEAYHAVFLYANHDFSASQYVMMLSYVAMVDAITILGGYFILSVVWKDFFWVKILNRKQVLVFFLSGLITATLGEYMAVYVLNKWKYNSLMPMIFGVGLSPLIQLSMTGLLVLWLTKRLVHKS